MRLWLVWPSVFATWVLLQGAGQGAELNQTFSSAQRRASRNVFGYDPTPDFIKFDPDYLKKHAKYAKQLRELQLELARQAEKGRPIPCSRQIFLEARWLVFYSARWDQIERRLGELREMLSRPSDPPGTREQIETDGSYDHCSETWFLKLDSTIEEVEDRGERGEKPEYPLKLLDRINSPEKLKGYLDSLLVSDVGKTGMDNRFELNIAITAIERFIVGHVGQVYAFAPGLKEALFAYEDKVWQDPETGFFGGWYHLPDGTIRKTADLSVTFHIVSYRRDSIQQVPQMMRTLIAMKDEEYPFGWREEAQMSNHHNYDVVRLFRVGWPHMDPSQRELARAEMRRMMDFCLKETMNPDGSFKLMDEDTVGSSFLFPISLLNELGYFRPSLRFWTWESFPNAMQVADRVGSRIRGMGLTDTESAKVLRRFEEARRERRAWALAGAILLVALLWIARKSASWINCARRRVVRLGHPVQSRRRSGHENDR
jgi:hypothetical protein